MLFRSWVLKPLLSILLLCGAGAAYFMNQYGVMIDKGMLRNIAETNPSEAFDLLSLRAEIERNQELQRLAQWWAEFQVSAPPEQKDMLTGLDEEPEPRRRHRRPRKRAPRREGTA